MKASTKGQNRREGAMRCPLPHSAFSTVTHKLPFWDVRLLWIGKDAAVFCYSLFINGNIPLNACLFLFSS